ncbi:MAG: hypothetical protein M3N41_08245, partial [Acidobacteriota bacterium]|nr:hypothetical protein [Acidobacteriota bacterium]
MVVPLGDLAVVQPAAVGRKQSNVADEKSVREERRRTKRAPGNQTSAPPVNSLRVLALVEAATVTGPAKNLIRFCNMVQADVTAGLSISIAAFHRLSPTGTESNAFLDAVRAAG